MKEASVDPVDAYGPVRVPPPNPVQRMAELALDAYIGSPRGPYEWGDRGTEAELAAFVEATASGEGGWCDDQGNPMFSRIEVLCMLVSGTRQLAEFVREVEVAAARAARQEGVTYRKLAERAGITERAAITRYAPAKADQPEPDDATRIRQRVMNEFAKDNVREDEIILAADGRIIIDRRKTAAWAKPLVVGRWRQQ
jgi:hypothetical protein